MDQAITPFDLERMVLGSEPALYYLEIIVRTLIVYLYAFILIRWVGKRATGQFSTIEIFLIVALGSSVGDPMFLPEVPLLHALVVITLVVSVNTVMSFAARQSDFIDRAINLKPELCVNDGVVVMDEKVLTHSEAYGLLRLAGIENLGQVRAAILEKNGSISVFQHAQPKPGLTILPPPDRDIDDHDVTTRTKVVDRLVCQQCGTLGQEGDTSKDNGCPQCSGCEWVQAEIFRGDG